MLHKEFNNGLRAYPTHQAVQTIGSTALCTFKIMFLQYCKASTLKNPMDDVRTDTQKH